MTPEEALHGAAVPVSKPGLPSFWPAAVQPVPPVPLTVHVNVVEPAAPVLSFAVAVTDVVPAVVGVPEMTPVDALSDRPAGSAVDVQVNVVAPLLSLACKVTLAAVPTVLVWLPGLVTVT